MKNKIKKILSFGGLLFAASILASCNSFCNEFDYSSYRYGYDPLSTLLFDSREDALEYINFELSTEEGYPTLTLESPELKIKSKTGEEINLISETKFAGYNLYFIHPMNLTVKSVNVDDDGNNYTKTLNLSKNNFIVELETQADANEIKKPFNDYYYEFDVKVLDKIFEERTNSGTTGKLKNQFSFSDIYGYSFDDYMEYLRNPEDEELLDKLLNGCEQYNGRNKSLLTLYGYSKYTPVEGDYYSFINEINNEIINENSSIKGYGMSNDFLNLYKRQLDSKVAALKTCISISDNGLYGHITSDRLNDTVLVSNKAKDGFFKGWGEAFGHGLFEGLLVYPIAYSVESLSISFGLNGWGQIWAVLLVTVIIRTLFSAITLPSTISTQKMNFIQPEVAKLQQKYPNAETNQYDKQRLAQAQMALYKKHGIHPFGSILVLFLQFPLFISVWNAMTGSASLSSDSVMGLYLSDTIWNTLTNFTNWPNSSGWWTALVLIILMSGSQIVSMLIPQWLNKKRNAGVAKTVVSESQKQTQTTTKTMSYFMTAMVIIMGFTLPSAMGVYWFAGAIFSIAQTLVTQLIITKQYKKGI